MTRLSKRVLFSSVSKFTSFILLSMKGQNHYEDTIIVTSNCIIFIKKTFNENLFYWSLLENTKHLRIFEKINTRIKIKQQNTIDQVQFQNLFSFMA